jgi:hypothetical protein
MLFDLRSRGRRRTIKVVYVTLAFLMGIGLVGFGIGGDVTGGIVDAITERGGGTNTDDRIKQREEALVVKVRANPSDEKAWADLARVRVQAAEFDSNTGVFTDAGRTKLKQASDAWEKYLALAGDKPDSRVASLMVQAYGPEGLDEPEKAVTALEIIAEDRPSAGTYSQLAIYAYQAGQVRKGDLASEKALELTESDMREQLKAQLDQAKAAAVGQQIQETTPTPTPEKK